MGRMQGHRLRVCALTHAFHQRGESVRPQNQVQFSCPLIEKCGNP
jgi:hypothetical protein